MPVHQLITRKSFTYRGQAEEWANVYHLDGTTPANEAAARIIAVRIMLKEQTILPSVVSMKGWAWYNPGHWEAKPTSVSFEETFLAVPTEFAVLTGTFVTTGGTIEAGDTAMWVRWDTGLRNERGKKIYLRKYFHPGIATTGAPDSVLGAWRTAAIGANYGGFLLSGDATIGGLQLCTPAGHHATTPDASTFIGFRQLKRRGKRPGS